MNYSSEVTDYLQQSQDKNPGPDFKFKSPFSVKQRPPLSVLNILGNL